MGRRKKKKDYNLQQVQQEMVGIAVKLYNGTVEEYQRRTGELPAVMQRKTILNLRSHTHWIRLRDLW